MALKKARAIQSIEEKRYYTINLLEAAVQHGSYVTIKPTKHYSISELNAEKFTYFKEVDTYVIFDERPKVSLLQRLGWYREDLETSPILAYIPTHLIYSKVAQGTPGTDDYIPEDSVVNYLRLDGKEFSELVKAGESDNYELKEIKPKRGTIIDIYYDFIDREAKFFVVDYKVDPISLNYVAYLMPYKHQQAPEGETHTTYPTIDFDSSKSGI